MKDTHQIFGIRAIIEAITSKKVTIDKVFIQNNIQGDLMKELLSVLKKNSINFSYVPIEKLNKLTKGNHQGAVASISPISFISIETLVDTVINSNRNALFLILDELSDTRNFG